MGNKTEAKLRRRENRQARDQAKAERTGDSPAQQAEKARRRNAPDPAEAERRIGLDGGVGGDTAPDRRSS